MEESGHVAGFAAVNPRKPTSCVNVGAGARPTLGRKVGPKAKRYFSPKDSGKKGNPSARKKMCAELDTAHCLFFDQPHYLVF